MFSNVGHGGQFYCFPEGPCTQIADTLAPKYTISDYFKAKVYTLGHMDP